jgi:hypothetical protein
MGVERRRGGGGRGIHQRQRHASRPTQIDQEFVSGVPKGSSILFNKSIILLWNSLANYTLPICSSMFRCEPLVVSSNSRIILSITVHTRNSIEKKISFVRKVKQLCSKPPYPIHLLQIGNMRWGLLANQVE